MREVALYGLIDDLIVAGDRTPRRFVVALPQPRGSLHIRQEEGDACQVRLDEPRNISDLAYFARRLLRRIP